jgi:antitoxin MazE
MSCDNIVITMTKHIDVKIRQIGNSHGVVIPKPIIEQIGFDKIAHLTVEGNMLVLRKPKKMIRSGWAKDAMAITASKKNSLVLGDFTNESDKYWDW